MSEKELIDKLKKLEADALSEISRETAKEQLEELKKGYPRDPSECFISKPTIRDRQEPHLIDPDFLLEAIKQLPSEERGQISDGYHTFDELYEHRCVLFTALCRLYEETRSESKWSDKTGRRNMAWRSRRHSDGSSWDGWFVLGLRTEPGQQITYHLPEWMWGQCDFATALEKAPAFDGHTSEDVLKRLKNL